MICEGNKNIKYTAIDGTLLGTVGQQSMILWETDVDVAMTPKEIKILRLLLIDMIADIIK